MGKIAKLCREFLAQNEHALEGLTSLYFVALFPFWLYLAVTLTIPQALNVATWVWNHPLHTIGICAAFVLVPTITAMVSVILWKRIVPFFIIASTGMGVPVTTILSLYGWLTANWQHSPPEVNLPFAGNILGTAGFFFLISFLMGVPMLLIYMKLHTAETEQPTGLKPAYQKTYYAEDGHVLRSKAEVKIDNYLFSRNIKHVYEKQIPGTNWFCDFYLPDYDAWIEYAGLTDSPEYLQRMKEKMDYYDKCGMVSVFLQNDDLKYLDNLIPTIKQRLAAAEKEPENTNYY